MGCKSCRCPPGSGPYKKWESKPLCDQNEEEASTSGADDDDRDVRGGRSRTDSCLQALFWINGGLLLVVIIVGTAVVRSCPLLVLHGRALSCPKTRFAPFQKQLVPAWWSAAGGAWASSRAAGYKVPSDSGHLGQSGPQPHIAHPVAGVCTCSSASTSSCGQYAPLPHNVLRRCGVAASTMAS